MEKIFRFLMLAAAVVSLRAAEPQWLTDVSAAKQQAQKENKAVLLDFTGSDWCGYCIKLHKAVFDKPEWEKFASKNLVLVEVDFPIKKKLAADQKKANEKLRDSFNVEGYPTIVVLDAQGKKLGELVGYEDETASQYIGKIQSILAKGKKSS